MLLSGWALNIDAQVFGGSPFDSASSCDIAQLDSRIARLDSVCCVGDRCTETCDVDCMEVIVPLLDDFGSEIDLIYDSMDGIRDGQARPLADAYNQCLDVPVSDLVEMLTALRDSGQCPAEILDGVGTTDSKADACEDVWSRNCGMAVESGFLTCDADFCNTVPAIDAPCDLAGHCDRTCGFCTAQDDGNHRRLLMIEAVCRRAQFSLGTCDTADFAAMTAEVDEACCDPGTDVCATGVPGECDAKCAVIYNPLYQQCSRFISAQVGLAAMSAYNRLHHGLLEARGCTQRAPPPCLPSRCCGSSLFVARENLIGIHVLKLIVEMGVVIMGLVSVSTGTREKLVIFWIRALALIVGGMGNVLVGAVNVRVDTLATIARTTDVAHLVVLVVVAVAASVMAVALAAAVRLGITVMRMLPVGTMLVIARVEGCYLVQFRCCITCKVADCNAHHAY